MKARLALVWRQLIQPRDTNFYFTLLMNHLPRFAVIHREGCSQHLVTRDDLIETLLQCRDVERTLQTVCYRQSVSGIAWLHLVDQPHLHLGKRERSRRSLRAFGNDAPFHGLDA